VNKISIRDLEQRVDTEQELERLEETLFNNLRIILIPNKEGTFNYFLKSMFTMFPYAGTSRNIEEFLDDRSIEFNSRKYFLIKLNFYSNFLNWLLIKIKQEYIRYEENIGYIRDRITYILDHLNYKNIEDTEENEYGFRYISTIKRNADVDTALKIVEHDIAIDLLSYLDVENENNLMFKESIMARLYKSLESKRSILEVEPHKKLFNDTKFAVNYHRHFKETKLTKKQKIEFCDKAFYMYIHLIRFPYIKQYQKDILEIKPK